jgi:ABC-type transport system substrate-binding protein
MKKIHVYLLIGMLLATSGFLAVSGLAVAQDDVIPFVVGTANGPGKLDPVDAYDSESIETIMQVCEGLYMYNYSSPEMESIPCLASAMGTWSVNGSGDLVILDIPLKTGVTFHDGVTKFNASAAKWNFDRLQYWTYGWDVDGGDIYTAGDGVRESHPLGTASKTLFAQGGIPILHHTEIVDEYTIRFVLNVESVIFEKLLAFIACAQVLPDPDYTYGNTFFNRIDINDELIGTGPFMLSDYVFDEQVVFDYNPNYHMTWIDQHIEQMIYLIVPDDVARSLAILNHEIHWGAVDPDYDDQFAADPDLVELPIKASVVYYVQMNLYNMPDGVRYASSFIWNHTYFLVDALGGVHYELHVPVPDGMQYHHEGFDGEPSYDVDQAQEIILNTPELAANLTAASIDETSTTAEWRAVAESTTPIAEFNYTRYESGTVEFVGLLLQDYLKDIGIKLNILDSMPWDDWVKDYLENPAGHYRLAYSFGGWGPDYNDPINMIEPLYGTGASSNCFGLNNATWNQKLIDTYSAVGAAREALFYDIQEDFCKYQIPSFYILQLGGFISFNKAYLDENHVSELQNVFNDLYWFKCVFHPPQKQIPGFELFTLIGVALGVTVFLVLYMRKRK